MSTQDEFIPSKLCSRCPGIFIKDIPFEPNLDHVFSIPNGQKYGCELCMLLANRFKLSGRTDGPFEFYYFMNDRQGYMMEVYDILFQPAGGQGIEHGTARLALQLTKLKDDDHNAKNKGFEKRFNSASYPTIPRCLTHLSNRTSSPQSLAQADEWFQNCLHNHEHCQRILPSTNFLPTGIPVKELSKVFRDTMLISKRMGFELIWIDSLCISQDSVLDWKSESTVMNSIYNHGVLNIASTGFHDGSAGLFVERSPEAFNQLQMVIDNECPSNGQAGKSNSSLRSGNYHLVDILA